MLQSLHIENVAVIEKADIGFSQGLTVLTGETGAGKSIVIDAINAVLGERLTRDVVRSGADTAFVSAVFADLPSAVTELLVSLGYEPEEDGTLLIQRSLNAEGKGNCRVNGRPATVSSLRQIGRCLVNTHGQHENQALLQPERHVDYLDRLGRLQDVRKAYEDAYHGYCKIQRSIRAATVGEAEKEEKLARLTAQCAEVDAAGIRVGEEADLLARRTMARHGEKLAGLLSAVRQSLYGNESTESAGALLQLKEALDALKTAGGIADQFSDLATRLQSALYEVQACAEEAGQAEDTLAFDEQELAKMEDRLALLQKLMKKYSAADESALLALREQWEEEKALVDSNEAYLADLQKQSDAARDATIAAAAKLTAARKEAAKRFEQDVCRQLAFLDMPHVTLQVSFEPTPLTVVGGDKVEFLLSSNPGEPPKSIARTASGGELSRIMLALKSVLADVDEIDTLIFDEVDAGISGRAATKVGVLLRGIAARRQVLCVTHLAQIAAGGHDHLLVAKSVENGRTFTRVSPLGEEEKLRELARIIGGEATATAIETAKEMRRNATAETP